MSSDQGHNTVTMERDNHASEDAKRAWATRLEKMNYLATVPVPRIPTARRMGMSVHSERRLVEDISERPRACMFAIHSKECTDPGCHKHGPPPEQATIDPRRLVSQAEIDARRMEELGPEVGSFTPRVTLTPCPDRPGGDTSLPSRVAGKRPGTRLEPGGVHLSPLMKRSDRAPSELSQVDCADEMKDDGYPSSGEETELEDWR